MMFQIEPGKYIVAVSGGVDSVALLNMLSMRSDLVLVVAHFDHGIREDSSMDAEFVRHLSAKYGLTYESRRAELGPNASEATAREKRYEFLQTMRQKHRADAIVTAHHQDDVIETALINLVRGTHRRGLSSLQSTDTVVRPLLIVSKPEIIKYAKSQKLQWNEDETNTDERYLRNFIRAKLVDLEPAQRTALLKVINETRQSNEEIDQLVATLFVDNQTKRIDRKWFIGLPYDVSLELLSTLLRSLDADYDRNSLSRLVQFIKTSLPQRMADIDKNWILKADKHSVIITTR